MSQPVDEPASATIVRAALGGHHGRNDEINEYIVRTKLDHTKNGTDFKVLDVGGSSNPWCKAVDYILDVNPPPRVRRSKKTGWIQSSGLSDPDGWHSVAVHVNAHGHFDFCICTHTLEDLANPIFAVKMLSRFCKGGFIATPSKYEELGRGREGKARTSKWRGYYHHRWMFSIVDGVWRGFPKTNILEYDDYFDTITNSTLMTTFPELSFMWQGSIALRAVNNDWLGPHRSVMLNTYKGNLTDDDGDKWLRCQHKELPGQHRWCDMLGPRLAMWRLNF